MKKRSIVLCRPIYFMEKVNKYYNIDLILLIKVDNLL